jgi:hypothetical protein
MKMMIMLEGAVEKIYGKITGYGPLSTAGQGIITSIVKLDEMIPVHTFQLIVGVYLIEVVCMIAMFLSIIKNGDENLLKRFTMGKTLLLGVMVYSVVLIVTYSVFSVLMPITGFVE